MEINEYPSAIAEVSRQINSLEERIAHLQQEMQQIEDEIRYEISSSKACDSDQRNATLAVKLRADKVYQEMAVQLRGLYPQRAELMTEVARLRDEFSIAKILVQREIAEMERCRNAS